MHLLKVEIAVWTLLGYFWIQAIRAQLYGMIGGRRNVVECQSWSANRVKLFHIRKYGRIPLSEYFYFLEEGGGPWDRTQSTFQRGPKASPSGDPGAGVLPGIWRNSIPEYFSYKDPQTKSGGRTLEAGGKNPKPEQEPGS
ncbi:hypothetical protein F2Q68_00004821 [Brassica cretica]|uniref:Uncharacterized protein n=1 Tax=Brassica cretica TaxID=69181 RepID=A0A8S9J9A4_BRACR|nr:hypothetical protein F2Q68_00004821 [Brassica cretica]